MNIQRHLLPGAQHASNEKRYAGKEGCDERFVNTSDIHEVNEIGI